MLTLISPAKTNLFLKILKKRPDGFHELASLFQAIDLHDVLHFQRAENDLLLCPNSAIPVGRENLIWKAIDLFRQKTSLNFPLRIDLTKNIPVEAGLGGGSSNAATALWAVNALAGTPVDESTLQSWAGEIGSDTAFFFSSGTAYCTGRGEIVTSLPPLPIQFLQIIKPHFGLSTPKVYAGLDLSVLQARNLEETLHKFMSGKPEYFNDLEDAALRLLPELQSFKYNLECSGFKSVMLSGSGSSFVCFGPGQIKFDVPFQKHTRFISRVPNKWYN